MTLFEVEELYLYWRKHPPIHLMLAGFFGISESVPQTIAPIGQEMPVISPLASIPGMTAGTDAGFPSPIFDVTELMRRRPN